MFGNHNADEDVVKSGESEISEFTSIMHRALCDFVQLFLAIENMLRIAVNDALYGGASNLFQLPPISSQLIRRCPAHLRMRGWRGASFEMRAFRRKTTFHSLKTECR